MSVKSAPQTTPTPTKGEVKSSASAINQRSFFLSTVLNMSWQLAIVVLVPILAGVWLDKGLKTGDAYTFGGLGLAVLGSIAVMWRTAQAANRLPVPKLTPAQKRAVRKSYEDEDKDE
jgi:hypothetical protein